METLERLGAEHLRAVVTSYRDALRGHQDAINRLNVYPVPDGDTGTNMALTLESVVAELDTARDMASVCRAISHGSLMGARGNSGVILSQILRGLSRSFEGVDAGDAATVAGGLVAASEAAYGAVMRPVEGTILTVAKAAGDGAREAAGRTKSLVDVLDAARAAAADALEHTPDLLPVLKQAGVVDAGGAGFLLLIDALLFVAAGRPLPEPPAVASPAGVSAGAGAGTGDAVAGMPGGEGHSVGDLRYEVMYFLEAPDDSVPAFK